MADLACMAQKFEDQRALALKYSKAKDKRRAMQCLKTKKLYDKELEQLRATSFALEMQMQMLESSVTTIGAMEAMRAGRDAQQAQLKAIGGAAGVEDTIDAVRETMEDQEEIGNMLAQGFDGGMDVMDDMDLQAELAGLEEEELDEQLADLGPVPVGGVSVAARAAAAPVAAEEDEEDELAELQAMMENPLPE